MITKSQNKAISEASTKGGLAVPPTAETSYSFPDHGITISAVSREEAEAKLLTIINKNNE